MADDEIAVAPHRSGQRRDTKETLDAATVPAHHEAGRWGLIISVIALLLSGVSLYETVLKQAKPAIYISGVMRYWRDPREGSEVFALPITIANHGMRDAVITSIGLSAEKRGQAVHGSFTSAYFGEGPEATLKLFSPISIEGHRSFAGTVTFYRDKLKGASAVIPLVDASDVYVFCVAIQTELSADWSIFSPLFHFRPLVVEFQAELPWFDRSALESGQTIPLRIEDAKRNDNCPGLVK